MKQFKFKGQNAKQARDKVDESINNIIRARLKLQADTDEVKYHNQRHKQPL